jgi:ribonuclease HI
MVRTQPHFLLFSQADVTRQATGRWHFILESVDGETTIEASDEEPGLRKERLELLAVVRGLEALDQPSRVTLVTSSQRITRGFRSGLEEWRNCRWRWERDGRWVPIKNRDLWQRVDRALSFHRVECRTWQCVAPGADGRAPNADRPRSAPRGWSWGDLGRRLSQAARPLFGWPTQVGHWSAAT